MKLLTTFVFLFFAFSSFGQIATTVKEAEKRGFPLEKLDLEFKNGLQVFANKPPLNNQEEAFYNAYVKMLKDLATNLKQHNFKWEKQTRAFNRIYFKPDGSIAYYLYNFQPGQISPEKEKQFNLLLNNFIKTYHFPLTAKEKFAQCSPAVFND